MIAVAPAAPLLASTVVLVRQGKQVIELLMIRRHAHSGFMPNATVFPGGKVDEVDGDVPIVGKIPHLPGRDKETARAFAVAALRELHEEAHVLLAVDVRGEPLQPEELAEFDREIESLRQGRHLAASAWHAALRARSWRLDVRSLCVFAHWLTPVNEPKRFDTYFFAAPLPIGQEPALDHHETTALFFVEAQHALHEHQQGGETRLPPPTIHTLERFDMLAQRCDHALPAVLDQLRSEGVGPRLMPVHFAVGTPQWTVALPWDPLVENAQEFIDQHGDQLQAMTAVAHVRDGRPTCDRFVLANERLVRLRD